jgi:L-fucose mutarotase
LEVADMLKHKLLHPEILEALAGAGHNARVLIADGNYPFSTALGCNARLVFLNLSPGVVSCEQALEAVVSAIPVQGAAVMSPATSGPYAMSTDPPVWASFKKILAGAGHDLDLERMSIPNFYAAAGGDDVALTIATGDVQWYSNILLSIGAVKPE